MNIFVLFLKLTVFGAHTTVDITSSMQAVKMAAMEATALTMGNALKDMTAQMVELKQALQEASAAVRVRLLRPPPHHQMLSCCPPPLSPPHTPLSGSLYVCAPPMLGIDQCESSRRSCASGDAASGLF